MVIVDQRGVFGHLKPQPGERNPETVVWRIGFLAEVPENVSEIYDRVCIVVPRGTACPPGFRAIARLPERASKTKTTELLFLQNERCPPDEVAIVIQGPESENVDLLSQICFCFGTPVDASWLRENDDEYEEIKKRVVSTGLYNGQNFYFHIAGTCRGLKRAPATARIVIKTRADEYYSDFGAAIKHVREHPELITTNNIFIRRSGHYLYHASDHLIAGTRENMALMFESTLKALDARIQHRNGGIFVSEQFIASSYIAAKKGWTNLPINADESRKLMKEFFGTVSVDDLGDFRVVSTSNPQCPLFTPLSNHATRSYYIDVKTISDI